VADRRGTTSPTRYLLLGGVALVAAASLIVWHFWDGRGDVLKPHGGPIVTVMDLGRSLPLDAFRTPALGARRTVSDGHASENP
jgi:hypothetical protein